MSWPFKEPTLLQRLKAELARTVEERINATAKVALWKADEKFKLGEIARLEAEIEHLTEQASAADDEEALEVEAAVAASERRGLRRIH